MNGTRTCLLKTVVIAILLISNSCLADTWISIGGGTDHFCHTCGYNGFNPGLGIQTDDYLKIEDTKLIAGGYYNSFHRTSMYAGVAYQPIQYSIFKAGLIGGLVSNYPNLLVPLMLLPVVSIEGEQVGVDVLGSPSMGNYSGLVSINVKFKL